MPNPLRQSIDIAIRKDRLLEREFYRLGINNPKGVVPSLYLSAHKAIQAILPDPIRPTAQQLQEIDAVLRSLRSAVRSAALESFDNGERIGIDNLNLQMRAYGEPVPAQEIKPAEVVAMRQMAVDATVVGVDQQIATSQALLVGGANASQITGDKQRSGILRVFNTLADISDWMSNISDAMFIFSAQDRTKRGGTEFQKQVVAALDTRTTETCRRAHGQIRDLDKEFDLTGTPRFADTKQYPPFHRLCRTSLVLYKEEFDDGLTEMMRKAAAKLAEQRAS